MADTSIQGKREGRQGVWLIDVETACSLIDAVEGGQVHNLLTGSHGVFLGADWGKEDAKGCLRAEDVRLALVFPPNMTVRHQLVAINDERRWAFDIGEIAESQMQEFAK